MSKLSIIEEVGRISAMDKQPENPFTVLEECISCDRLSHYAFCDNCQGSSWTDRYEYDENGEPNE